MSGARNRDYQAVCKLSDIVPGQMRCFIIDGITVLIANVDGDILATDDMCTHEDASLASGALRGEHVRCPLHGSRFSLRTGRPLEEPAEVPLRCYPTRVENGQVFVALAGD